MEVSKHINPDIIKDGSIEGDKKIKEYPPLQKGSGWNSVCQDSCTASWDYSHAEGYLTKASGFASHSEGNNTKALNGTEHAEGELNLSIANKTVHTVGIGSVENSIENRKNAHEIHFDGKHYIYGIGGYDGTNSQTEGTKTVQEVVGESANAVSITYAELKSLRGAGKLVPGTQYRITDYTCTTTQSNTQSAGHQFDIIVTADDASTLNEVARAVKHNGDTYFNGCNLNAWKIWYCLDNDTTRFDWVDGTNGKGVIYRMIDEFNNDCPYDFKNIQFKRYKITSSVQGDLVGKYATPDAVDVTVDDSTPYWCYTFSTDSLEDVSLDGYSNLVYNNIIPEYHYGLSILNNIVFIGTNNLGNRFGVLCSDSTFGNNCYGNIFGNNCSRNTFGGECYYNIFGNSCSDNTFGNNLEDNTFGNYCNSNTFGDSCMSNTFGNDCRSITFGDNCSYNTFGNACSSNTFGDNCSYNTFGNTCYLIKFASDSATSTKYSYYRHNHFGDGCQYILFKGADTSSPSAQVQNYNFSQGLQGTSSAYLTIEGVRNLSYEVKVAKNSKGEIKIYCEADLIA